MVLFRVEHGSWMNKTLRMQKQKYMDAGGLYCRYSVETKASRNSRYCNVYWGYRLQGPTVEAEQSTVRLTGMQQSDSNEREVKHPSDRIKISHSLIGHLSIKSLYQTIGVNS